MNRWCTKWKCSVFHLKLERKNASFLKKVQKEIKQLHFIFVYLRNKDVAEVSKNLLPQFKNASE